MASRSLAEAAVSILSSSDPVWKAEETLAIAEAWKAGKIDVVGECEVPDTPAAPAGVELVDPWKVAKRGKGGSEAKRLASLHSLCHIEQAAINLSWDIVARFVGYDLPREFYDDWVRVAAEEAKHYSLLAKRLTDLGSFYGALPAHDGLWESAKDTADSLEARLAIVHMVHEARGLDVHPAAVNRFRSAKDEDSVEILENAIFPDEVTHVAAGVRWFKYLYRDADEAEVIKNFHAIVRSRFRGNLKPPFNHEAREEAGFTRAWYEPLAFDG